MAAAGARVQVEVGTLDPRLKLAPCDEIQPYVPANARLWGRSRIGLRCAKGTTRWNVYPPITVKVFAPAVAARALPAGAVLEQADLAKPRSIWPKTLRRHCARRSRRWAARWSGRCRPAAACASRTSPRQWFAAGETVQLVAQGPGFQVGGTGQALNAGIEGQPVRIRTDSGASSRRGRGRASRGGESVNGFTPMNGEFPERA